MNGISLGGLETSTDEPTEGRRRRRVAGLVGLLARLALGGVLLAAGMLKLVDLDGAVRSVVAYDLLDYEIAAFIGLTLPVLEVAVGALLILGLLTRGSAAVGTVLMLVFIAGIASAWARGLSIDCGCFGTGGQVAPGATRYLEEIVRDAALAVAGVWLVVRPHTPLSVDGLLTRRATDGRND
jgi:uncharacterized membrane protein YphA (DoxX/SURF4 family)